MQSDVRKVFYFNTNASALGGYVGEGSHTKEKFRVIPSHASVSLPSAGGAARDQTSNLPVDDVVACKSTYTHVSGHAIKKNGPWVTRATSVVEGLDILGVLKAKRVVAQIFIEHPDEHGGPSRIAFGRSYFDDLTVNGNQVIIGFNRALLPPDHVVDNDIYDEHAVVKARIEHPVLSQVVQEQSKAFDALGAPAWVSARHGSAASKTDHTICSIVDKIEGVDPIQTYGHVMDVPEVGRFFFGELMLHSRSIQLTMVRAELGCKTTGQVSAATAKGNGLPWPPI